MTVLVTTSRKPAPELRTLAKDLAFSLQSPYRPRGKAGLYDTVSAEDVVVIVSNRGHAISLQLYAAGDPAGEVLCGQVVRLRRSEPLAREIRTGNQTVYELLGRHLPNIIKHGDEAFLEFHGAQGRKYRLSLKQ